MKLSLTMIHLRKQPMKRYQQIFIISASIDEAKQIKELPVETATLYTDVTIRVNLIRSTKAWN